MVLPQSPPTTSGIIVISGSQSFNPSSSDFGVVIGDINNFSKKKLSFIGQGGKETSDFISNNSVTGPAVITETKTKLRFFGSDPDLVNSFMSANIVVGVPQFNQNRPAMNFIGFVTEREDIDIRSTPTTTSGIVVVDFFPGAGVPSLPFVPPIVINERIFPIFQGTNFIREFPATVTDSSDPTHTRIFPVLPQFSILTPGD